ncbi:hypothetical protein MIB92_14500 [Aestuariirhabdus sp. Z084]|uniref:hypothetical protein n=1 Tax=Aestuariirhabdus haliotis TaxID=2918751 RepID=UPI00201B3F74|nr:hypothetical protein [Aestuariirhabdus haliotis]MCL6416868.1 hypothetical protein [Aestuariirhabdus haliotis]MCL6420856.1 hypothetical protein [Aestuariirhabdus haliotis]
MKSTLPILFTATIFSTTAVMAEYPTTDNEADTFFPKVRVSEHSLGYNYPGSKYEIAPHADPEIDAKMVNTEVKSTDEAYSFFPKIRVDEHSLGYNYPGSKHELLKAH